MTSTKHQQITDQTSASKSHLNFNFKLLTKPCAESLNKSLALWPNLSFQICNKSAIQRNQKTKETNETKETKRSIKPNISVDTKELKKQRNQWNQRNGRNQINLSDIIGYFHHSWQAGIPKWIRQTPNHDFLKSYQTQFGTLNIKIALPWIMPSHEKNCGWIVI